MTARSRGIDWHFGQSRWSRNQECAATKVTSSSQIGHMPGCSNKYWPLRVIFCPRPWPPIALPLSAIRRATGSVASGGLGCSRRASRAEQVRVAADRGKRGVSPPSPHASSLDADFPEPCLAAGWGWLPIADRVWIGSQGFRFPLEPLAAMSGRGRVRASRALRARGR